MYIFFFTKFYIFFSDILNLSLRLDFQSMSLADAAATGACSDYFEATGDTGQNPPRICGTNTGYHSKTLCQKKLNGKFRF